MLDLFIEHLLERISPRQVEEVLDKNYHTTRSLLRKMEAAGEIRHVNSHYVAIPGNMSCNQRNQPKASVPQPAGQIARAEELWPSATDYSDYVDYANASVLSIVPQTFSTLLHWRQVLLGSPHQRREICSLREALQDAQDHQDIAVINVIKRNIVSTGNLQMISSLWHSVDYQSPAVD